MGSVSVALAETEEYLQLEPTSHTLINLVTPLVRAPYIISASVVGRSVNREGLSYEVHLAFISNASVLSVTTPLL